MKKIVLEEHYSTPALATYALELEKIIEENHFKFYKSRLTEFDSLRIEEMDKHGITTSVLSVTTPGVQIEPNRDVAISKAKEANDFLATVMQKHPGRIGGFAHLPLQDPKNAADELERCVKQMAFSGALINGHTNGEYLDHDKFSVLWERAEALNVPLYLHPANGPVLPPAFHGYPEMAGPTWEWTTETSTHAMRLIFGGVFDRYPKATLILGHMGETLPFVLWRLDSRYPMMKHAHSIKKVPSQYVRDNIMITTSGACDTPALLCSILSLGADRIMFSVDYPYESTADSVKFIMDAPISEIDRAKICYLNAARMLHLNV